MFVNKITKSIFALFESRYPLNNQPVKVAVYYVSLSTENNEHAFRCFVFILMLICFCFPRGQQLFLDIISLFY